MPEECIATIAGKRQFARLPGFVVTYAAFLHVTLAGLGINYSHTGQDMLRSRPVQESDGLSTLQARPSEYLRACHPTLHEPSRFLSRAFLSSHFRSAQRLEVKPGGIKTTNEFPSFLTTGMLQTQDLLALLDQKPQRKDDRSDTGV
jgi:hypothetical protein